MDLLRWLLFLTNYEWINYEVQPLSKSYRYLLAGVVPLKSRIFRLHSRTGLPSSGYSRFYSIKVCKGWIWLESICEDLSKSTSSRQHFGKHSLLLLTTSVYILFSFPFPILVTLTSFIFHFSNILAFLSILSLPGCILLLLEIDWCQLQSVQRNMDRMWHHLHHPLTPPPIKEFDV